VSPDPKGKRLKNRCKERFFRVQSSRNNGRKLRIGGRSKNVMKVLIFNLLWRKKKIFLPGFK
jgi:hypothetical protein